MPRAFNATDDRTQALAQQALRNRKVGKTWRQVEKDIQEQAGHFFHNAYLSRVAKGEQLASEDLCVALGVEVVRHELVEVCPKCGKVHKRIKSCKVAEPRPAKLKLIRDMSARDLRELFKGVGEP
jgi:predicted RNA-binding Zn-ribbon protein involved in translation (DUF1610 family)